MLPTQALRELIARQSAELAAAHEPNRLITPPPQRLEALRRAMTAKRADSPSASD